MYVCIEKLYNFKYNHIKGIKHITELVSFCFSEQSYVGLAAISARAVYASMWLTSDIYTNKK